MSKAVFDLTTFDASIFDEEEALFEKALSGVLSTVGVIGKLTKINTLAGVLTSAGVVASVKTTFKALSGILTASGTLGRTISKALAGVLTSSGSISVIKRFIISLAGTLTSSGAVVGLVKRFKVLTDFAGRDLADIITRALHNFTGRKLK